MRAFLALIAFSLALVSTSVRADAGGSVFVTYKGETAVDLDLADGHEAAYSMAPDVDIASFINEISEFGHRTVMGRLDPYSAIDITFDLSMKLWYTDVAGAFSWLRLEAGGFTRGGTTSIGIGIDHAIGAGWDYRHYDGSYHETTSFTKDGHLVVSNYSEAPVDFWLYWGGTLVGFPGDPTQPEPPSPIPEPETYALLLAGLFVLVFRASVAKNRARRADPRGWFTEDTAVLLRHVR